MERRLPGPPKYIDGGGNTGRRSEGSLPLVVHFTNLSTNGTAYSWDFGDGTPPRRPPARNTLREPRCLHGHADRHGPDGRYAIDADRPTSRPAASSRTSRNTSTSAAARRGAGARFHRNDHLPAVSAPGDSGSSTTPPDHPRRPSSARHSTAGLRRGDAPEQERLLGSAPPTSAAVHTRDPTDPRSDAHERGQALVEFALVLPVLLLLIFGIVDAGRLIYTYNTVSNAARNAARVAIVNQSTAGTDTCDTIAATAWPVGCAIAVRHRARHHAGGRRRSSTATPTDTRVRALTNPPIDRLPRRRPGHRSLPAAHARHRSAHRSDRRDVDEQRSR